ncbi:MAG: hypothetical protein MJ096_01135 [Clostridia bacterium]|nr:hypothetical protein [Clostridia bacterium]
MEKKIWFTMWNYIDFENFNLGMVEDWARCGLTAPMGPRFNYYGDSHEDYLKMLDLADSLGMKVIVQMNELYLENYYDGAEKYRATVKAVYDEFGSHPAFCGFYVGEEPDTHSNEAYFEGVKIIKEVCPEKMVYINLGSVERTERMLLKGEKSVRDWCCDFTSYTGTDIIGYGTYSQLMKNGIGIDDHFQNIHEFVEDGKKAGAEIWATLLSSAHYNYRIPTEDDFRWQISTAVACGCKAVVWFKWYDKLVQCDYRGSPIDEFGEKSAHFYDLARVQKKFNVHYAELFARLSHVVTYGVGVGFGGYLYFLPGLSDLVSTAQCRSGLLSFFKDENGVDYAVVVNTLQDEACPITLTFTDKVKRAANVYYNGKQENEIFVRNGNTGDVSTGEIWLAPGQMEVIKLG